MPDEAKAEIDQLVTQLKAEPKGAYIEIEGHTDTAGTEHVNYQLGLERAENVKRYIYETAPGSASPDQRDQLRRREADRAEQDQRRPRAEPPRRHQGAHLVRESRSRYESACPRRGASSSRPGLRRRGFVSSVAEGAADRERNAWAPAGLVRYGAQRTTSALSQGASRSASGRPHHLLRSPSFRPSLRASSASSSVRPVPQLPSSSARQSSPSPRRTYRSLRASCRRSASRARLRTRRARLAWR